MAERITNDFATTSSQALTSGGLTLAVVSPPPSELLDGNFRVRIEDRDSVGNPSGVNAEFLNVTAVSLDGTQWTVVREAETPGRFPAASHASGSVVTHVFTAESLTAIATSGVNGSGSVGPFREGHTFAVLGSLTETTALPSFFVPKHANQSVVLAGVFGKVASGGIDIQITLNGANVGSPIAISSVAAFNSLGDVELDDGDEISAVLSGPEDSPDTLSATIALEWSVP